MKREIKSALPDMLSSVLYLSAGIIMRNHFEIFMRYVYYTGTAMLFFGAIKAAFAYFVADKDSAIFESIANIILGLILLIRPSSMMFMMQSVCGIYMLSLSVVHIISVKQRRKDNAPVRLTTFILPAVEFYFAIRLFCGEEGSLYRMNRILGLYFICYGVCIILDIALSHLSHKNGKKRKIYIALPAVFTAFVPRRLLRNINRRIRNREIDPQKINRTPANGEYDTEVFIHMADTLYGQVGHVDLCFDNYVLSYGNYDESSYRLNGLLGDGVVEIIDREKYIMFCLKVANKHIVSYGIKLSEVDKKKLQEKLKDILDNLEPWQPPVVRSSEKFISSAQYELDYASSLYNETNALFYKFRDGKYNKFKTYFGLTTNCAALAEEITSEIGVSLFDFSGILTPGTYYDYLDSEYRRKNSFVVSRMLYASASGNNSEDI